LRRALPRHRRRARRRPPGADLRRGGAARPLRAPLVRALDGRPSPFPRPLGRGAATPALAAPDARRATPPGGPPRGRLFPSVRRRARAMVTGLTMGATPPNPGLTLGATPPNPGLTLGATPPNPRVWVLN